MRGVHFLPTKAGQRQVWASYTAPSVPTQGAIPDTKKTRLPYIRERIENCLYMPRKRYDQSATLNFWVIICPELYKSNFTVQLNIQTGTRLVVIQKSQKSFVSATSQIRAKNLKLAGFLLCCNQFGSHVSQQGKPYNEGRVRYHRYLLEQIDYQSKQIRPIQHF